MGDKKDIQRLKAFYEENMYGTWRSGEKVSFELLGEDPNGKEKTEGFRNPFEVVGGELVKIKVEHNDRKTEFTVHAFLPEDEVRKNSQYRNGCPFIICMHPIAPSDYALKKGWALIVMEITKIASDDTRHAGAFYDIYPYGEDPKEQTGVLMAWAWGVSKVLDAVRDGLKDEFSLDPNAALATGVSRYGKSTAVLGAFDDRFRMVIPACSGAGGLALYNFVSTGKTYDLRAVGGPAEYTYGKNEPLDCLQSDAERGWFNDSFLKYKNPSDIPEEQYNLPVMAMSPDRYYFIVAACTKEDWVNAPAMWECYKKADEIYLEEGLADHLVINFHKEGHAVLEEDLEKIIRYFDHMYYKTGDIDLKELKTSVFAGQEKGDAPVLRIRPYKSCDSKKIASWLTDEKVFYEWGGERFGSYPIDAEIIDKKYTEQNGDCEEEDNFYPFTAYDETGVVGHFIMRYTDKDNRRLRFGWFIVDKERRGRGYGKRMLELGLKYAFEILKARVVTIGVYEHNIPAYKCYKSLGFNEVPQDEYSTMNVLGETGRVIELSNDGTAQMH